MYVRRRREIHLKEMARAVAGDAGPNLQGPEEEFQSKGSFLAEFPLLQVESAFTS